MKSGMRIALKKGSDFLEGNLIELAREAVKL